MKKPKSKYNTGAVELGKDISTLDHSINLLGVSALSEYDPLIADQIKRGYLTEDNRFSEMIGDGCRLFYKIEHCFDSVVEEWETGIGYFHIEGDEHILDRETPFWGHREGEKYRKRENAKPRSYHNKGGHLKVSSIAPSTFMELFSAPYSIVASIGPSVVSPVEIEENTLLGRQDDIIQSIDMGELKEMEGFAEIVTEIILDSQKQMKIKARRLDLTRKNSVISAPVLRAAPVYDNIDKPPAQQGMIIYNKDTRKLEFFDGMDWNPLG